VFAPVQPVPEYSVDVMVTIGSQTVLPGVVSSWYLPDGHVLHDVCPGLGWCLPVGHWVHEMEPDESWYRPDGQNTHDVVVFASWY
jgi:hypothetical protein